MTSTSNNDAKKNAAPGIGNRRYLKATLAGGAGGLLALLFFLLEQRPELARLLLERVLIAWGPQFVIVLLLFAFLYLLADRYAPRLIAAQSETALALQNLARAVEQLVARENTFQREQDVLLNHVARRVDSLHKLLESHHRALNGHLKRLSRWRRRSKAQALPASRRGARRLAGTTTNSAGKKPRAKTPAKVSPRSAPLPSPQPEAGKTAPIPS